MTSVFLVFVSSRIQRDLTTQVDREEIKVSAKTTLKSSRYIPVFSHYYCATNNSIRINVLVANKVRRCHHHDDSSLTSHKYDRLIRMRKAFIYTYTHYHPFLTTLPLIRILRCAVIERKENSGALCYLTESSIIRRRVATSVRCRQVVRRRLASVGFRTLVGSLTQVWGE